MDKKNFLMTLAIVLLGLSQLFQMHYNHTLHNKMLEFQELELKYHEVQGESFKLLRQIDEEMIRILFSEEN